MSTSTIREKKVETNSHTTFYLAAGPTDGPLIIFIHGWPELSISWRHQLPVLADLGFHAIAPDMRGYGRSTVYTEKEDYRLELIVADMIQLLDALDRKQAIWVGHDWGSPVVWNIASHHPECCVAAANLCVPYRTLEQGLEPTLDLVDRELYPEQQYPAGQWDYIFYYQENFARATAVMEANTYKTLKLAFRKGSPDGSGKPSGTASFRNNGGWFGGADEAPDLPRDNDVVSEEDLRTYTSAMDQNGFFGANSWYMNFEPNANYAKKSLNNGFLDMPVLFVHAAYDYACETISSQMAEPMREYCRELTESTIESGHWIAQEKPKELNIALQDWLEKHVPDQWAQRRN